MVHYLVDKVFSLNELKCLQRKYNTRKNKDFVGKRERRSMHYKYMGALTASVFLLISIPIVLLKKLASRGFKGPSFSMKLYNLLSKALSLARQSLICGTSEVSNSDAIFEYLKKNLMMVMWKN